MSILNLSEKSSWLFWAAGLTVTLFGGELTGQRPRFPDFFQAQPAQVQPTAFPGQAPAFPGFVAPANQAPVVFSQGLQLAPPPPTIAAPVFDPFQSTTQPLPFNTPFVNPGFPAANSAPSLGFQNPNNVQVLPPVQPQFQQPQSYGQPIFNQPQIFQQAPFQQGQAFPRASQSGQFFQSFTDDFLPRLLERPRVRHTWLPGGNGNELQINDTEIATTLTFPRFLFVEQPVRITPGFIAHFWDGPETLGPFGTGFDLPETAFSGFLNLEHFTDPSRQAGLETNVTVGIYSDYNHLDSDSLRLTGVGLGWVRLNQTNILKFGAEYLDRIEVKLLPAFGVFIRPTPDLELDLYFPRPRIAQRMPNFRNLEVWAYLAGEYGGGNWTVERIGGLDDRIDINDFRAIAGLEWVGPRGVNGFVETGYVFDRELVSFAEFPARTLELQDTIMVRLGVAF